MNSTNHSCKNNPNCLYAFVPGCYRFWTNTSVQHESVNNNTTVNSVSLISTLLAFPGVARGDRFESGRGWLSTGLPLLAHACLLPLFSCIAISGVLKLYSAEGAHQAGRLAAQRATADEAQAEAQARSPLLQQSKTLQSRREIGSCAAKSFKASQGLKEGSQCLLHAFGPPGDESGEMGDINIRSKQKC